MPRWRGPVRAARLGPPRRPRRRRGADGRAAIVPTARPLPNSPPHGRGARARRGAAHLKPQPNTAPASAASPFCSKQRARSSAAAPGRPPRRAPCLGRGPAGAWGYAPLGRAHGVRGEAVEMCKTGFELSRHPPTERRAAFVPSRGAARARAARRHRRRSRRRCPRSRQMRPRTPAARLPQPRPAAGAGARPGRRAWPGGGRARPPLAPQARRAPPRCGGPRREGRGGRAHLAATSACIAAGRVPLCPSPRGPHPAARLDAPGARPAPRPGCWRARNAACDSALMAQRRGARRPRLHARAQTGAAPAGAGDAAPATSRRGGARAPRPRAARRAPPRAPRRPAPRPAGQVAL
jgi:hypothetical protein